MLFDAVAGGYLHELFSLECAFLTTDIAFREVRTIPAVDLHNFGLKIRGLDGKQVLEMFKLRGNYPALSMEDISVMVLARHTGAILLSGEWPTPKGRPERRGHLARFPMGSGYPCRCRETLPIQGDRGNRNDAAERKPIARRGV
ncbi:MAG: hypothetical protein PHQ81_07210 [Methanofollis sp.]|nr:hypothetical protein [Methanofollis sp.]